MPTKNMKFKKSELLVFTLSIVGVLVTYLFYSTTKGFIHSIGIDGALTYSSDFQGGIESDAEAAVVLGFIFYPLMIILFLVFKNQMFLKRFFISALSIINLLYFWSFSMVGFILVWETILIDTNINLLIWVLIAHLILPSYFLLSVFEERNLLEA